MLQREASKNSIRMNWKRKPYEWSESPPAICNSRESTASSMSLNFSTSFPTHSSTPRLQSYRTAWNDNEHSTNEEDDCSFHVNRFDHLSLSNMQRHYAQGEEMKSNESRDKSIMWEESASETGSPECQRKSLMTRPKPYNAFLDDIKKHEFDTHVESWKKAQELAILDRLKRKEAVISEWEYRHASKATEEMKNYERELEKKRAKMLEKLHKSLNVTKAEANKKALKARHEAKEKMSQVFQLSIKARATNNLSCLKL